MTTSSDQLKKKSQTTIQEKETHKTMDLAHQITDHMIMDLQIRLKSSTNSTRSKNHCYKSSIGQEGIVQKAGNIKTKNQKNWSIILNYSNLKKNKKT